MIRLIAQTSGTIRLIALLLCGAGLRLSECLELRVKDIDVDRNQIAVRSPKGGRDRMVPLPHLVLEPLAGHLAGVRRLHDRDLGAGLGRVVLPTAIAEKYPSATAEWRWQFAFPAGRICRDPRWGPPNRFHLHESAQELLWHRDVCTTMIYTHVLARGPSGVRSPADRLAGLTNAGKPGAR